MTLLGSAGLALGLGNELALAEDIAVDKPKQKATDSAKPQPNRWALSFAEGNLTVKQSTKFTTDLFRQNTVLDTKDGGVKNNPRSDLLFKIVPHVGAFLEHILSFERKPLKHFNKITES